ncbi:LPS export ABC transporter permease LptG [Cocleimonas flava]|jgi:lipopolysaccharide export system permease protein|uniref:Lipopolysaccharide export system permease protein n=1 Tax=Cocleimonas flava TaxID=634765 RepID=A0A4R1ER93_9GAMM|nr:MULTISPECIES: LPS export ABC transporter permease LptG [Cocleimonas]MEB8432546.1 LPS export ABC transporter permease LptG [Cocleimonas sp. KMM 6892]MEC4715405.1 LPS export ABC transporter permease LptG [Cocleimonas sp. KMM 6895]MEC4744976.1 LPS export ABC transporter permease LptG [Cocleimonas sp. KMM 6896]TCJ82980.1 lipopolysaccharide export system permease protein [Cocleimonas flava]
MKILDRYLWTSTIQGILIAWLALVILDTFFAFINEAGKTNALYTTLQAIIYLIYTLPASFYEFFPTAVLIGTLLGLGNLAANSEFIAMRAAGVSIGNIVFSVIKLGTILAIGIFIVGEWVVPASDLHARNFKAQLKNKNIVLVDDSGLWVKEKQSIIKIGKVLSSTQVSDVSIYSFKEDHSGLETLTTVKNAKANEDDWNFHGVNTTTFKDNHVLKTSNELKQHVAFINPNVLNVANTDPSQLSSSALSKIIEYQKENAIKTDKYELIYWKRFSIPLSTLVMLILAMPFLFGSNRGGGMGQRIFVGILVGIVFYLANRTANELGAVYGFSPLVSAFLPSVIFLFIGLFAISRKT